MTSEDVEQVIKDQSELWIEKLEKPKDKGKGKGKETEAASQTRKDPEKEKKKTTEKEKEKEKTALEKDTEQTDKSKTSIGKKRPCTTDTGSSPRTKWKSLKPAFHTVFMENNFEGIADRVYGTMTEPLTAITTVQEVLKQMIETQVMKLKMLMRHTS